MSYINCNSDIQAHNRGKEDDDSQGEKYVLNDREKEADQHQDLSRTTQLGHDQKLDQNHENHVNIISNPSQLTLDKNIIFQASSFPQPPNNSTLLHIGKLDLDIKDIKSSSRNTISNNSSSQFPSFQSTLTQVSAYPLSTNFIQKAATQHASNLTPTSLEQDNNFVQASHFSTDVSPENSSTFSFNNLKNNNSLLNNENITKNNDSLLQDLANSKTFNNSLTSLLNEAEQNRLQNSDTQAQIRNYTHPDKSEKYLTQHSGSSLRDQINLASS